MADKKPPYSHRQMAEVLFKTSGPFHNKKTLHSDPAQDRGLYLVLRSIAACHHSGDLGRHHCGYLLGGDADLVFARSLSLTSALVTSMGVFISITGDSFMPITVNPQTKITMLDPGFNSIVNDLLKDTSLNGTQIVAINIRDPTYCASNGGYHPVEIHVDSKGNLFIMCHGFRVLRYPADGRTRYRTRLQFRARLFQTIRQHVRP
jgi:hypothetical protein